jgi:hypothetical protein
MHAQERSILRLNIRRDIVYYYPFDDYKTIKNFNAVITVSVGDLEGMMCSGEIPEKADPADLTAVFPGFPVFSGSYRKT